MEKNGFNIDVPQKKKYYFKVWISRKWIANRAAGQRVGDGHQEAYGLEGYQMSVDLIADCYNNYGLFLFMFVATIDQKALLFYIAAASINALLIMTFLAYPTLDGPTIWKKLSFFTNFNQLCVAFFYLYRLVSHIDLPRRNNQAASAIHSMLLVLGAVITAFFWITYAINPHILLSKRALDVIPFWLLFAFHGGNFIFLLIEYLLVLPPT
jgi:hypothetical protein